jgi:APA family basic amino acid/polyamine antiporter
VSRLELPRSLGLFDASFLVAGIVIGSGIFLTTGIMARDLPSAPLLLFVWAAGGALSLAGALAYAELGAMMPAAGGQYVYLKEAYGDLAGFLFGWITLLVYQSGSIAAVSVGFAEYFGTFFPALGTGHVLYAVTAGGRTYQLTAGQITAVAATILLTWINVRGVRQGANVGNFLTAIKVAAIAAFVIFGFILAAAPADQSAPSEVQAGPVPLTAGAALRGLGIAVIAVLWSYDGWNSLNFSAGEIRRPARNIPLALFIGTGLVTILYVSVNAAYLRALSIQEMSGVTRVAEKAAEALWGGAAASLIAAAVMISSLGCVNGMILTGARVYYAMSRDGLFFRSVGRVHSRCLTPANALWVQAVWSVFLTLTGTYDQLFTYVVFAAMLMYAASAASLFTLRRTRPKAPRPYRAWGYPVLPALYIASLSLIIVNTLYTRPLESIAGLALIGAGIPVFYYFKSRWVRG